MFRASGIVLLALLLAGGVGDTWPAASAGELSGEEKKWVRECVKRLEANSPSVRRSAEKALIEMGLEALPDIVANLKDVRSRTAQSGVERVLKALGRDRVVKELTRLRPSLRSADAKRVDALLAALGESLVTGSATAFPLKPATDLSWETVPFGAEHALTSALPAALGLGRYALRVADGQRLEVDADGNGSFETRVRVGEQRVVRAGPGSAPRSVLLYEKRGTWYAASASLLRGEALGMPIELLDGDADGRFDGARDFLRVRGGAFIRQHPVRRIATKEGLAELEVVEEGAGHSVKITALPVKGDASADQLRALRWLNEYRNSVGLLPLAFDPARSRACVLHARYLVLNADRDQSGGNAHFEDPAGKGYTPEGANAGGSSAVVKGDLASGLPLISRTMLHRIHYLSPSTETAGFGSYRRGKERWMLVWMGSGSAAETGEVVVVPGVGQQGVSRRGSAEWPPPDQPAGFYKRWKGHPVSVTYTPLPFTNVNIELFRDGDTTPLTGRLFSPEHPIATSHAANSGTAFFMPMRILEARTQYWAVFTAHRGGVTVRRVWTFTTG